MQGPRASVFTTAESSPSRSPLCALTPCPQLFKKFDHSGDGQLNLLEFTQAIEEFGYGQLGHDIFLEVRAHVHARAACA